ncbi:MAG: hypothetical protein JO182_09305 [Acidobacteriaceae bacterium]|nr:hypothetical protein [Acidobacteriaceae bacterium]MBV9676369.1 hypothetical protein [Acidobacteriaceae bacterium]
MAIPTQAERRELEVQPTAPVIMVIRHAEKPTPTAAGVKEDGDQSSHDLIVQGWQRAGALACFFAPTHGPLQSSLITTPKFLFASAPPSDDSNSDESKSHRPEETINPLSEKLGLKINLGFAKGQEQEVAQAAQSCNGPVLIAWQHENIYDIAKAIPGGSVAPQHWPGDRFDIVFVFTLDKATSNYNFAQVPQSLLAGDLPTIL